MASNPKVEPARPRSVHPTGRYAALQVDPAKSERIPGLFTSGSGLFWKFMVALVAVVAGTSHLTRWWVLRDEKSATSPMPAAVQAAPAPAATPAASPAVLDTPQADSPWQLVDPEPVFVEGQAMPLRALVRVPATMKPRKHPLAVIVHGTHGLFRHGDNVDRCPEPGGSRPRGSALVNSAAGMVWIADALAAQGMVSAILDAGAVTCVFGLPGAHKRKELALGLLKRWSGWQTRGDGPLPSAVMDAADLNRIVLVGHSSGADGVALVASELAHPRNPLAGQVQAAAALLITPPDFVRLPHMPCPVAVWVAGCDGDVGAGTGERMFERWASAAAGQQSVLWTASGGVHNAANDQWRDEVSDGATSPCAASVKLGVQADRALLGAAAAAWLGAVVRRETPPAWTTGSGAAPQAAGPGAANWKVRAQP